MQKRALIGLGAALMFSLIGCAHTDYCSCVYKHEYLDPILNEGSFDIIGTIKPLDMWCPVNDPDNDVRIEELLMDKGVVFSYPFTPYGKTGLQLIHVLFPQQQDCAKRLVFEAACRGEVKVVFEDSISVVKRAGYITDTDGPPRAGMYVSPATKPAVER